jgi:hypothetical protein
MFPPPEGTQLKDVEFKTRYFIQRIALIQGLNYSDVEKHINFFEDKGYPNHIQFQDASEDFWSSLDKNDKNTALLFFEIQKTYPPKRTIVPIPDPIPPIPIPPVEEEKDEAFIALLEAYEYSTRKVIKKIAARRGIKPELSIKTLESSLVNYFEDLLILDDNYYEKQKTEAGKEIFPIMFLKDIKVELLNYPKPIVVY